MNDFTRLAMRAQSFSVARNWEEHRTPRNLAMAIASEAGELLNELQWIPDAHARPEDITDDLRDRVSSEAADVLLYLIQFADLCDIDLIEAAHIKISHNESRYPITSPSVAAN